MGSTDFDPRDRRDADRREGTHILNFAMTQEKADAIKVFDTALDIVTSHPVFAAIGESPINDLRGNQIAESTEVPQDSVLLTQSNEPNA